MMCDFVYHDARCRDHFNSTWRDVLTCETEQKKGSYFFLCRLTTLIFLFDLLVWTGLA